MPALLLHEPVAVEDSTRGLQIQMFLRKSRRKYHKYARIVITVNPDVTALTQARSNRHGETKIHT